jgi:hypothetical protein
MRKLVFMGAMGAIAGLALAALGCNGSSSTPSEPTPTTRGNWIGTISGVHSAIHLNGTCTLEMQLSPIYQGQWWVDCPGGSSTGQVSGVTVDNLLAMALLTSSPASSCPWNAVTTVTASTIGGTFQVIDCATNKVVSSGTLSLTRR